MNAGRRTPEAATTGTRSTLRFPLFVALSYAVFSAVWILASDRVVDALFPDAITAVQTVKGWAFILVTAALLFAVLLRESHRRRTVEDALRDRESRLRRERELLEAVLRQAPVGISIARAPDGVSLILNDRVHAITQIENTDEDASRYGQYGAMHPDGRPYAPEDYPTVRALRHGMTIERESMLYHRPDGRTVELEVTSSPVLDEEEAIAAAVTIVVDVTASRTIERALRERESLLHGITRALPGLLFVTDAAGNTIHTNRSYQDYTGLSADALLGDGWLSVVHPDDRPKAREGWNRAVADGGGDRNKEYEAEYRFRRHDGDYRTHLVRGLPEPEARLWVGTCTDIEDRKRAERALADSEERLRRAIEDAPFPVMVHAEDGTVVHISQSWLEVSGYRRDELATTDDWTARAHGERRQEIRAIFDRLYTLDSPTKERELTVRTADGRPRLWTFRTSPIGRDRRGRRLVVTMAADITERKDVEDRLRLLMREVDHRAKNALAVVQSIVMLSRAEDPAEFARAVEGRVTAMARAHALLSASRWSGADLAALIREELHPFVEEGRATFAGPSAAIAPEATQSVSMILHELMTNAVKYGALSVPEGRVGVSWRLDLAGGRLSLTWTERGGPPVAPPARDGFGSTLLKQTVLDQLRGELDLEWLAEGLHCRIALPPDCFVPGGVPLALDPQPPAANDERPAPQGACVLVVEDEALTALGLEQLLESAGYRVLGPVSRVQDAIDLLRAAPPDAAVLDVNLFGQPSFPVAEALDRLDVPFLFCTGYGRIDTADERLKRAPVLSKPVPPDRLLRAVGSLLKAHPPARNGKAIS